jgi:hypothetical protein
MARAILCDSGDGLPYRYMLTDVEAADTKAYCEQHFLGMCIDVINAAVEAMPPDDTEAEPEADQVDVAVDMYGNETVQPPPGTPTVRTVHLPGVLGGDDDAGAAAEHEARVHAELAKRPDGAATSEATVPWPDHVDSGATD